MVSLDLPGAPIPSEGVGSDILIATDNHRRSRIGRHKFAITLCGFDKILLRDDARFLQRRPLANVITK